MTIAELYPVHCDDMNAQHAQMHSMLEELAARVRSSDQAAIEHQLRSFIRYGKMHFADEEQFMKSCEYPKRWDHEQEHSNLVQKLEDNPGRAYKQDDRYAGRPRRSVLVLVRAPHSGQRSGVP